MGEVACTGGSYGMTEMRTLGAYDFPAADRQELFGEDQLVNVHWDDQIFVPVPACFRVPKSMKWSDFKTQMIDTWAGTDPDYRADAATDWRLDDDPIEPQPDQTIADLGIVHKGLVRFRLG